MTTATKEAPGNGTKTVPAKQSENLLAVTKRTYVDVISEKARQFIAKGELQLPKDYSVNNALKAAWLILQSVENNNKQLALKCCTPDSIANALLDMIVMGLNPSKKQCYFIVYGDKLTCQRSYMGAMVVAKMVQPKIDDFAHAVVYEKDVFKYGIKNGKKFVTEHEQDIHNVDKKKIIAAYCIALDANGEPFKTEIMTMADIVTAWSQSKVKPVENGKVKDDSTHGKFTEAMALKTVINKTCKLIINASSDNVLLREAMSRADELTDMAVVEAEIEQEANTGEVLGIEGPQEPIDITAESKIDDPPEITEAEMQKQADEANKELQKKGPNF
jgi:recombination protein RecT